MTKEQIKAMTSKEFRDWLTKLNQEGRLRDIYLACKIRLK